MNKPKREVQQIEMVETYNIYRSIQRIKNAPMACDSNWKRALYHALGMAYLSHTEMQRIREALQLP